MKLLFAGDFAPDAASGKLTPETARHCLAELAPVLQRADYRILNLESVLISDGVGAKIPKSGPNLRGVPEDISFLEAGGFDVAALANNHFGDYGYEGVRATLRLLSEHHILAVGGGETIEEAYRAVTLEKDGIRVALLSVCENEFGVAGERSPGSAGFDLARLARRIREEKASSDFVIVFFHGGNEQNPLPAPATVDRYRILTELGTDAVIAGHTHCIQGYETYQCKPIVYSMGNFYFPHRNGGMPKPWHYGYMCELEITKEGITPTLHPYRFSEEGREMHLFTGEERETMLRYIAMLSSFIDDRELLTRYFEGWCTTRGTSYANALCYDHCFERGDLSFDDLCRLAPTKNLFGCESHDCLLRTLLSLEMENRFEEAVPYRAKLEELQQMPL